MIPFASQRAGGQDLATHLMNAHDNETIELAEIRGAIARDLHGAFAEWEALASALTRCRQYLCSLSINPDELQGRITRAQYLDYITRAEDALGLTGQPRAVVFHIKQGEDGRAREHCHVIWSRIDARAGKAVNLSFFKDKLMTVTREFARDHQLKLPAGYYRHENEYRRNRQLSRYDCVKQKETGITHEQRMAVITAAWQRSDNARAYVNALADSGYILARGRNETRIVLVDFYGHISALTRLIDDPAVKAKDVRAFLGADYAPDQLPSVEQAKAQAAARRQLIEDFEIARAQSEQVTDLKAKQDQRRARLEAQRSRIRKAQHEERMQLAARHKAARQKQKSDYLAAMRRIRRERALRRPQGLAAFLGRITGATLIVRKIQRYRDRKRYEAYLARRAALKRAQRDERRALARRQKLQAADINRALRALQQIERRERAALEQGWLGARRRAINARHAHMPPITITSASKMATGHHRLPLPQEFSKAAQEAIAPALAEMFARVSAEQDGEDGGGDETTGGPHPATEEQAAGQMRHEDESIHEIHERLVFEREQLLWDRGVTPSFNRHAGRHKTQRGDEGTALRLTKAFARAAGEQGDEDEGGEGRTGGPNPASEQQAARRAGRNAKPETKAARAEKRKERKLRKQDKQRDQDEHQARKRWRKRDLDKGM